jgi:thiopeptide-type bacteriocin biosynthesis protein
MPHVTPVAIQKRTVAGPPGDSMSERVKPPGSEWLFAKLYYVEAWLEELMVDHVLPFAEFAVNSGRAEAWFFVNYADPERHIRLRFRGRPDVLIRELMPEASAWGAELTEAGVCLRVAFDTYQREIVRYGGAKGMAVAELVFAADSIASAELLRIARHADLDRVPLAVLSVDSFLGAIGLDEKSRLAWCQENVRRSQTGGEDYRNRKRSLREALVRGTLPTDPSVAREVAMTLRARHQRLAELRQELDALVENREVAKNANELAVSFVHMHLNRFLVGSTITEREILELLLRTRVGLNTGARRARR